MGSWGKLRRPRGMARTISWEQRAQMEEKARHRRSMRTLRAALAVFSVLLLGVGSTGIGLGAAAVYTPGGKITSRNSMSPICCGACFFICSVLGLICARKTTAWAILCFIVACIISLVFSIVTIQLLRVIASGTHGPQDSLSLPGQPTAVPSSGQGLKKSVTLARGATAVAGVGCATTIILTFLACRVAREEKRRLFMMREGTLAPGSSHQVNELT
ncbi:transmembrane protein 196-like [Branchiostoma floridae]|uniref:Transmembrane protein 196 n=1 Tax=Branchiostoma floridae TaxID=7739 RepID=A0A9J7L6U4_BRAFL|nr:transmembrane protein 196-like [Branchiostoma floridae]